MLGHLVATVDKGGDEPGEPAQFEGNKQRGSGLYDIDLARLQFGRSGWEGNSRVWIRPAKLTCQLIKMCFSLLPDPPVRRRRQP